VTPQALRQAREHKGWSIEDLARRAGLRARTVEMIEDGRFDELPAGLYGRSSIRSYATAVGLDAQEVLEAFGPQVPSTEDPLDGLARRCGHVRRVQARAADPVVPPPSVARAASRSTVVVPKPAVSVPVAAQPVAAEFLASAPAVSSTLSDMSLTAASDRLVFSDDEVSEIVLSQPGIAYDALPDPIVASFREPHALPEYLEIDLAGDEPLDQEEPFDDVEPMLLDPAPTSIGWWRPLAASGIDLSALAVLGAALVWLTALASATTIPLVLRSGGLGIGVVFAVIVGLYFVLFGGVGNATPGRAAMGLDSRSTGRTVLNARDVFARAYRSVYRDRPLVSDDQPAFAERG
jgi:transcriptional regulator with XRE-family HTH domain